MNSKLKQIIQTVKSELGKDPSSIIIGKICDGNKKFKRITQITNERT